MALTAGAALLTAYANYKARPLLLRTKEMHSDDLKRLLESWKEEVNTRTKPDLTKPLAPGIDFRLDSEGHVLFPDLENHVPGQLHLFGKWCMLKERRAKVDSMRVALCQNVEDYLTTHSGMGLAPAEETSAGVRSTASGVCICVLMVWEIVSRATSASM